ncbi:hypothetical protein [Nocardioides sp. L-11A]|uniref:hypothetical protein n=1 Tax=Nocardioides sp. L-11A TaxID=3043848 RepID=UPI00249ADD3D|nr:hypothetical protein QJ852_07975 [Nocardioides sp. L-11A]
MTSPRLAWRVPEGWRCFAAEELATPGWRAAVPPAEPGSAYETGLVRFEQWVAGQGASRVGWVLVLDPDPNTPGVVAFGSIDVRPGPDLDELERQVADAALPDHLVSRTLTRTRIAGRALLLCHELAARDDGPTGAHVEERGLAVRHLDSGLNVAVDLLTTDLAGFAEIATTVGHACAAADVTEEVAR